MTEAGDQYEVDFASPALLEQFVGLFSATVARGAWAEAVERRHGRGAQAGVCMMAARRSLKRWAGRPEGSGGLRCAMVGACCRSVDSYRDQLEKITNWICGQISCQIVALLAHTYCHRVSHLLSLIHCGVIFHPRTHNIHRPQNTKAASSGAYLQKNHICKIHLNPTTSSNPHSLI